MQYFQQLLNGLTLGAIYALIALGYTMVYGVMRLINFAHGDVYMLGAYAGLFSAGWFGVSSTLDSGKTPGFFPVALVFLTAMAICAVIGIVIERLAYRPLRNSSRLAALITAIGVSMFLEFGGQAVFSPDPRQFPKLVPDTLAVQPIVSKIPVPALQWLLHQLNIFIQWVNSLSIPLVQSLIIILALALMLGLQFIVTKTKIGRAMRAVSHDRTAASLMGINTDAIITFTFALGSALAGAGGVLNSLYTPKIDPLIGLLIGLKAFVAAVLGGIGSIPGAVLGGLLLGFAETATVAAGKSEYRDAIAFAILIAVLLLRPTGILGKNVAEKV